MAASTPSLVSSAEQTVVRDPEASRMHAAVALQNAESGGCWSAPALDWVVCSRILSSRLLYAHEDKCPLLLIHSCL